MSNESAVLFSFDVASVRDGFPCAGRKGVLTSKKGYVTEEYNSQIQL